MVWRIIIPVLKCPVAFRSRSMIAFMAAPDQC